MLELEKLFVKRADILASNYGGFGTSTKDPNYSYNRLKNLQEQLNRALANGLRSDARIAYTKDQDIIDQNNGDGILRVSDLKNQLDNAINSTRSLAEGLGSSKYDKILKDIKQTYEKFFVGNINNPQWRNYINQHTDKLNQQPITNPSTPSTQPTTQPITQPTTQPTTQPITQPITQPTTQPITQPATPTLPQKSLEQMRAESMQTRNNALDDNRDLGRKSSNPYRLSSYNPLYENNRTLSNNYQKNRNNKAIQRETNFQQGLNVAQNENNAIKYRQDMFNKMYGKEGKPVDINALYQKQRGIDVNRYRNSTNPKEVIQWQKDLSNKRKWEDQQINNYKKQNPTPPTIKTSSFINPSSYKLLSFNDFIKRFK